MFFLVKGKSGFYICILQSNNRTQKSHFAHTGDDEQKKKHLSYKFLWFSQVKASGCVCFVGGCGGDCPKETKSDRSDCISSFFQSCLKYPTNVV